MVRLLPILVLVLSACAGGAETDVATTAPPSSGEATASARPAATGVAVATPGTSSEPAASASPMDAADLETRAEDVVRAWIDALAGGDFPAAHALLGGETLEQYPTPQAMADEPGLVEGAAAYAQARDVVYDGVPLVASGEGELGVVVISGTVTREGTTEADEYAAPYLVSSDETEILVDPFRAWVDDTSVAARYGIQQPARGATVACDAPVVAAIPGADGVVHIDGREVVADAEPADGDQSIVTVRPADGWPVGDHVATVAFVSFTGEPGGWSVPFTVTEDCG